MSAAVEINSDSNSYYTSDSKRNEFTFTLPTVPVTLLLLSTAILLNESDAPTFIQ